MGEFAAFLGVAALVIITPGQDTALVIRNTLRGGTRGGVLTALGINAGVGIWVVTVSLGLATLLLAAEPVFVAIRIVGAAYLVWLGLQALRDAFRRGGAGSEPVSGGTLHHANSRVAFFRQGMLSNLGNPKIAVFFTSFLPQFASSGGDGSFISLLALGCVFCLLNLSWLSGYAAAVTRAGDLLRRPKIRRVFDGLTGGILILLGLRIAVQHR